jgi:acyl carrier protein phosphodiesterase
VNYLAHLYLSDQDPLCRLGNLMGDFVKGPLQKQVFPPQVLLGLRQHRNVDRLAMTHPAVRNSRRRLDIQLGHTRGILVDIFYDHLLAKNWDRWAQGTLRDFANEAYRLILVHDNLLPNAFKTVARKMVTHDWLCAYQEPKTIGRVLERMALRLKRPNLLKQGLAELDRWANPMQAECRVFLYEARSALDRIGTSFIPA